MSEPTRTPLIAGNWKMNGSLEGSEPLVREIVAGVGELTGVDVLVCPPYVYLQSVAGWLGGTAVRHHLV